MVTKINIDDFGMFQNYHWDNEFASGEYFKRVNIIYGKNYSGKTTLSRIFKSIEDEELPKHFPDASFEIIMHENSIIDQDKISPIQKNYDVRVFNTDFIQTNLSWLTNADGTIQPFAVFGEKNVELEGKINEVLKSLGSVETKSGLLYEHYLQSNSIKQKNDLLKKLNEDLDDMLRNKAKSIRTNPMFGSITYILTHIKKEINSCKKYSNLSSERVEYLQKMLNSDAKADIPKIANTSAHFSEYLDEVNNLITKNIDKKEKIPNLINNPSLQEWVRLGMALHNHASTTCGFCGNRIDTSFWKRLHSHFSQESNLLRNEIERMVEKLEKVKLGLNNYLKLKHEQFLDVLVPAFNRLVDDWEKAKFDYCDAVEQMIVKLKDRQKDIFREKQAIQLDDVSVEIVNVLSLFNNLIDTHNTKTHSLNSDRKTLQIEYRKYVVANFLKHINYDAKINEIAKLEEILQKEQIKWLDTQEIINNLNDELNYLESQTQSEGKAAELINHYLHKYFGKAELKLVTKETVPNSIYFRVLRNGDLAYNLSEGECCIIAFCYFFVKLSNVLNNNIRNRELIVFIDDPISGLDNDHIYFVYNMIEKEIAIPMKYTQLFISTHNLEFVKYLTNINCPIIKGNGLNHEAKDKAYFIIEKNKDKHSVIRKAPAYLSDNISEFNYLFSEIYKFAISSNEMYSHYYYFINVIRKFLDVYLYYKYPSNSLSPSQRAEKFFNPNMPEYNVIQKLLVEPAYSDGIIGNGFELGKKDDVQTLSKIILNRIKTSDPEQFDALLDGMITTN